MPDSLPPKAKKIWEAVYNSSIADKDSKEVAARKAWGAVKMSYKKDGDMWVEKNGIVEEMDTFICKASIDPFGNMRLRLVASDTTEDSYKEKMSVQLFKSFVSKIESGAKVPDWCREVLDEKSGWDGGMPYCSISHYKSGIDGKNIPADSDAVYVDGSTLKARVKCRETEIGRSLFHSIKEDIDGKSKFPNRPVRVSIGFLDLMHSHGNFIFHRTSLHDKCPMCAKGVGDKVYLDGQLFHFAFTRVPANKGTDIGIERSDMTDTINTVEQDAESIVGKSGLESLEVNKSEVANDVLVQKSDEVVLDNTPVVEESAAGKQKDGEDMACEDDMEDTEVDKKKKGCATKSALDVAVEDLVDTVSKSVELPREDALASIQTKMDTVGEVIRSLFPEPVVEKPVADVEQVMRSVMDEYLGNLNQTLASMKAEIASVSGEVATLKSNSVASTLVEKSTVTVPAPRTAIVKERSSKLSEENLTQIQRLARATTVGNG